MTTIKFEHNGKEILKYTHDKSGHNLEVEKDDKVIEFMAGVLGELSKVLLNDIEKTNRNN